MPATRLALPNPQILAEQRSKTFSSPFGNRFPTLTKTRAAGHSGNTKSGVRIVRNPRIAGATLRRNKPTRWPKSLPATRAFVNVGNRLHQVISSFGGDEQQLTLPTCPKRIRPTLSRHTDCFSKSSFRVPGRTPSSSSTGAPGAP